MMFGFEPTIPQSFLAAVRTPLFTILGIFAALLLLAVLFTACELRRGRQKKNEEDE